MWGGCRSCRPEVDRGSGHRFGRVCGRLPVTLGRRVGATDKARAPSEIDGHHVAGSTGVGKTYLACALGQHACRQGYRAIYRRLPRFFQELALARADGSYSTVLARLARVDVLILDDWGLAAVTDVQRQDLLEVMEDRDASRSTVITSQLPRDQWHAYLGDPTIADAVLDRLVHNAFPIALEGPLATQGQRVTRPRGPWTLADPWTRGRAHRSLENRADAVSHSAHRHHRRLRGGRKQNEDFDRTYIESLSLEANTG
jgi:hypothetical protein